jgi:hypothetical protein
MVESLISLLILVVVLGIVCWVVLYCIRLLPIEAPFQQIATALVIIVALLIFLTRALPLLGVSI